VVCDDGEPDVLIEEKEGPGGRYYVFSRDITVWAENGSSIMIKTNDPHGDPVELGEGEVSELIGLLSRLL